MKGANSKSVGFDLNKSHQNKLAKSEQVIHEEEKEEEPVK
jgi:hypothetical protein